MKNIFQDHLKNEFTLNQIDWARIVGIYLVVLGHMQYCGLNINVKNFIYLFHMPLFFVISGMLHKNSWKKAVNSFCGMVFLFALFNIPFIILKIIHHDSIDIHFINANIPTWFFLTLAFVKLICYNITKTFSIAVSIISVIAIQCIHSLEIDISSYLYIKSILMALPFFLIGYYAKDILTKPHRIFLSLMCLVILIFSTVVYGRVDIFVGTFRYTYLDYYIVALCGVFLIFEISNRLPQTTNRVLWTISRGTAIIVGCHYVFCVNSSTIPIHHFILPYVYAFLIIAILIPIMFFAKNKCSLLLGKINVIK